MKYEFINFRNNMQKNLIKGQIESLEHLFPFWVNRVVVAQGGDDQANAKFSCSPQYRECLIVFHNDYFAMESEEQIATLLHEFSHLFSWNFAEWVLDNIVEVIKEDNPKLAEFMEREIRERSEIMAEELSILLHKISTLNKGL